MSMNCAGYLNHNLHHKPSVKPRESPTTSTDCETQNLAQHKKTLVFTTQQTTLSLVSSAHSLNTTLLSERPHHEASGCIMRRSSMGTIGGGAAVVGSSVAGVGSGRPPLRAVKGNDNGTIIISAPPFTFGVAAWGLAVAAQQSWAALWLGSGRP